MTIEYLCRYVKYCERMNKVLVTLSQPLLQNSSTGFTTGFTTGLRAIKTSPNVSALAWTEPSETGGAGEKSVKLNHGADELTRNNILTSRMIISF